MPERTSTLLHGRVAVRAFVIAAVLGATGVTVGAVTARPPAARPPVSTLTLPETATVVSAPRRPVPSASVEASPAADPPGPTPTLAPLGVDSRGDVAATGGFTDLIRTYFGDATLEAVVIVQCESEFLPDALNTNVDGTQDHGLFQINDVHKDSFEPVTGYSWDDRYVPIANVAFAAWLHSFRGWEPWRCNVRLAPEDQP